MCDCIETTDGFLAEHGTSLVTNLLSKPLRVVVATYYSGPKKRGARASTMLASYCPFCGERYPEFKSIFDKAEAAE